MSGGDPGRHALSRLALAVAVHQHHGQAGLGSAAYCLLVGSDQLTGALDVRDQ